MSYIVYHPDTGTIVAADDAVLVNVDDLPADYDEWEEYLEVYGAPVYKIIKGKELL